MNIVQLDFDTLEGLFCQPNNQVNIGANNVGTMIANFSTINNSNGSVPNSCPNSPATNRRLIQQQKTNNQLNASSSLLHSNQLGGVGYHAQFNSFNLHQQAQSTNQANSNLTNLNSNLHYGHYQQASQSSKQNQSNFHSTSSSQTNVGQLNDKLESNGRNLQASVNYLFDDRKQATLKRCSGEFTTTTDYMHNLLDSKRSLNVNIFLKQFRSVGCSNDGEAEIVRLVKQGDHAVFGAEKLVHLIKLLPDPTEIDLLKAHSDDKMRLPLAERFLQQILAIPKYKLRLECMLLKAEYEANFSYLNPSLDTLINAARELENCRKLHEVLYLILIAGNFLNSSSYAGDAAGFKMTDLLKLSEIRANKPNISLIHYVALQADKKHLSSFVNELSSVEKASKISLESLKCDINSLANKIFKIKQQINSTNDLDGVECADYQLNDNQTNQTHHHSTNDRYDNHLNDQQMNTTFFKHMREFLSDAEKQIKQLTQKVETDLEQIRTQLGEFLCEELNEFKLEECFRIFSSFITKFKLALEENAKRKDEFKSVSGKESNKLKGGQSKNNPNSNDKLNEKFNSLPRFKKTNNNGKFFNSSFNNNLSIMNLAEESDLDPGLVEFLSKANELNGNNSELFNGLSTFRRVGSGRRSFRQLSANVFANNEIDFSSRERLNTQCKKIAEENSLKKGERLKNRGQKDDDHEEEEQDDDDTESESVQKNKNKVPKNELSNQNSRQDSSKEIHAGSQSLSSLSASNSDNTKSITPTAVVTPTLYSPINYSKSTTSYSSPSNQSYDDFTSHRSSSSYLKHNQTSYSNSYVNSKILERAQSQLSLNSIGKSNQQKVVPIRSNPLTPLQTTSNGSLERLNSGSCYGSSDHFTSGYADADHHPLKDYDDFRDLKESSTNLKTCIQSLESLNNITSSSGSSSRYQATSADKDSFNLLTCQEHTRSFGKQLNKSPLQSWSSYNSLKRGSSERHSFKYQVASKVDCHNPIANNRNLFKENSHAKDELLDSCKYILPKTSPVLSTLNRASILRMSLNRKTAQEAKDAKSSSSIFHSTNSSSTPVRISTTTRPINLNPKKGGHYNSVYIEPSGYIDSCKYIDTSCKSKSGSLATIRPLSRVNSFRNTLDRQCHQSRPTSRSTKNVHSSTSAHSNTRQPRWIS